MGPFDHESRRLAPSTEKAFTPSSGLSSTASLTWQLGVAAFLIPLAVYLATIPGNVTEANDAFWYALAAEDPAYPWFHHNHMLYFPVIKWFNEFLVLSGYVERTYGALVYLHIFVGALSIPLFYLFLHARLKVDTIAAFVGALLLAFSYGFWRYSAEVEIPVWTTLSSLALLYLGFRESCTARQAFGLGLIAAVAILFHGLNAFLACTIIPLRLLRRSGWAFLAIYTVGAALLLFSVYGTAYLVYGMPQQHDTMSFGNVLDPIFLFKGLVKFGQATVSANFIWGNGWAADQLQALFVSKTMAEEIYMGRAAPPWLFYASVLTFALVVIGAIWVFVLALKHLKSQRLTSDVAYLIIWCLIFVGFLVSITSGTYEIAVSGLVPIWALVTVFIFDVLCRNGKRLACVSFAALFLAHNLVGGMAWVWSEHGDRWRARSAWLIENAGPDDTIVTAEKSGFTRYLQYWVEAEVVNLINAGEEHFRNIETTIMRREGQIFVLQEVFKRPAYLCIWNSSSCDRLSDFTAGIEPNLERVAKSGPSIIYRIKAPELPWTRTDRGSGYRQR